MQDEETFDWLSFRRRFPGFRLLEAVSIALAPTSILIATGAGFLLSMAEWIVRPLPTSIPMEQPAGVWSAWMAMYPLETILKPWISVVHPVVAMLNNSGGWLSWAHALIHFGLALSLWSVVGTILSRRAAMRIASNDESTLSNAVDYARRRWTVSILAPLIPLFSAAILGLVVVFIGNLGQFPFVGEVFLVIMSPVIAVIGFGMAFLLVATALGWPLMIGSIATDDCDGFGALSRSYSQLTGRPWNALGFAVIALLCGFVLLSFVSVLGVVTVWCGISSTALGSGQERAERALMAPFASLVRLVVSGIGISYFWAATTVISLLLRREVDGAPLERLSLDDDARPVRDPLPVVGIPATDARETIQSAR